MGVVPRLSPSQLLLWGAVCGTYLRRLVPFLSSFPSTGEWGGRGIGRLGPHSCPPALGGVAVPPAGSAFLSCTSGLPAFRFLAVSSLPLPSPGLRLRLDGVGTYLRFL